MFPDLNVQPNLTRWTALEAAKRRLLVALEKLGLPPYVARTMDDYPLSFEFKVPTMIDGLAQPISTGHAEGVITIDAEEADSDRREATRLALGEPHRTLIGHMRHEIGHYIDWSLASRVAFNDYVQLFGNPSQVDYEQAKQRHYTEGPPGDWALHFVSAYATMHPWEDFAETVNAYLDIMAIAETANDQRLAKIDTSPTASLPKIVEQILPMAVAISEFNADLGLQPLLPEQLVQPTIDKLAYVHQLRSLTSTPTDQPIGNQSKQKINSMT
ncbi:MAG: putative zinc-binding metallopeptidase [Pirellulaceae bacterium]|nr:putative zinc-binding metallopeptidase [Pirellulaceae bacterium]